MTLPYSGVFRLVSLYGYRIDPFTGEAAWHGGIDLAGENSKEIRAVAGGTVLRSRIVTDTSNRTWEWGNYISVIGDDGMTVFYCHLSARLAEAGQRVEAGDIIGIEGSTGRSTGSHLHLEVRNSDSTTVSAAEYIGISNEVGAYGVSEVQHDDFPSGNYLPNTSHDWSAEAVLWAVENGIIIGDGTGDLMLGNPCTREQMCVLLHRMYKMITERG